LQQCPASLAANRMLGVRNYLNLSRPSTIVSSILWGRLSIENITFNTFEPASLSEDKMVAKEILPVNTNWLSVFVDCWTISFFSFLIVKVVVEFCPLWPHKYLCANNVSVGLILFLSISTVSPSLFFCQFNICFRPIRISQVSTFKLRSSKSAGKSVLNKLKVRINNRDFSIWWVMTPNVQVFMKLGIWKTSSPATELVLETNLSVLLAHQLKRSTNCRCLVMYRRSLQFRRPNFINTNVGWWFSSGT